MSKSIEFTKMQGLGNDYIYFDCTKQCNQVVLDNPNALALRLSDRHFSIGGDGIILICPSDKANYRMRMFNMDGSEGMMCGNGIRCVARYIYDHIEPLSTMDIETNSGIKHIAMMVEDGVVKGVRVDMGAPTFYTPEDKQLACDDSLTYVSVGNSHCVMFTEDIEHYSLKEYADRVGSYGYLDDGANAEIANVLPDGNIEMRVWERGTGETMACGTGACAVLAAAVYRNKISGSKAVLRLKGGELLIEWDQRLNTIFMQGPAEYSFTGKVEI